MKLITKIQLSIYGHEPHKMNYAGVEFSIQTNWPMHEQNCVHGGKVLHTFNFNHMEIWWQTKLWLWIRFVAQCVCGHMDALNYMDELWHDGYNWTSKMVLTIDLKGHMKLMVEIIHIVDENICSQFFFAWM
jgi:hypothetical protein